MEVRIRRARTSDVRGIRRLVDHYAADGSLLDKPTVTLFEDIQEFWVAEDLAAHGDAAHGDAAHGDAAHGDAAHGDAAETGPVAACGALHVMWEDLAEVRTIAADPAYHGYGLGHRLLERLLETARQLGIRRVFVLTFEVEFFARHGFRPIEGTPVSRQVYGELLRSYDEGVAEFLELEWVKPNTLGNIRMLRHL